MKIVDVPAEIRDLVRKILRPLIYNLQERLELFDTIPDLSWYVTSKSFLKTKKLIVDFLEDEIERDLLPSQYIKGGETRAFLKKLSKIPAIIKNMKTTLRARAVVSLSLKSTLKSLQKPK